MHVIGICTHVLSEDFTYYGKKSELSVLVAYQTQGKFPGWLCPAGWNFSNSFDDEEAAQESAPLDKDLRTWHTAWS